MSTLMENTVTQKRMQSAEGRMVEEPDLTDVSDFLASKEGATNLAAVVGANLRRLRVRRGLSLERFSRQCGVSRSMLSQIELGRSAPTINVIWKISRSLGVTFSALMSDRGPSGQVVLRASGAKMLASRGGTFTSRALFPFDEPRRVEFYELGLAMAAEERADPHPPGTMENLVVNLGSVEIEVDGKRHSLDTGDAILFEADVPHLYRNRGRSNAVMYLVMVYADTVG